MRLWFEPSPGKKLERPSLSILTNSWAQRCAHVNVYLSSQVIQEAEIRRMAVQVAVHHHKCKGSMFNWGIPRLFSDLTSNI
jgi:hypothetical protein